MQRMIKILIAEAEAGERDKLTKLFEGTEDLELAGVARNGRECLDLATRLHPNVVLINRELPGVTGLEAAQKITTEMPEIGVILILNGNEREEVFHKMLRVGIRDFVTRPIDGSHLLEEVRRVSTAQTKSGSKNGGSETAATATPKRNQIITVTGPRGGCGKTVLATNLAVGMAGISEKIALLDLNLWGGDVAMLLDLTPRRTLGDILPGFGGIDHDVVDSVVAKHNSGLSVLAAPLSGTFDGTTLSKYMVQSILDALREQYECAVVDTGYANLESTLAAMDGSDIILAVIGNDLPRLRDGKHYLKNLMAANYPKEKIRVVINRATVSREISASEIESILEFPVTMRVPIDESVVSSSVNLGQPFVLAHPQKQISKTVFSLAEALLPTELQGAAAGRKPGAARWFSFLH